MPERVPHGARVYFYDDGVILVKQTIKSRKTGTYSIDIDTDGKHKQRHIDPDDNQRQGRGDQDGWAGPTIVWYYGI